MIPEIFLLTMLSFFRFGDYSGIFVTYILEFFSLVFVDFLSNPSICEFRYLGSCLSYRPAAEGSECGPGAWCRNAKENIHELVEF